MSRKMVSIQEAAKFLGVSPQTLRRWEREGRLLPDERTPGGRRRYDLVRLRPELFHAPEPQRRTIAYARVSSPDQKDDLERQKQVLERYCARQGWTFEEDLAKEVLEIITVFSARLYGSRSRKTQKLIEGVRAFVEAAQC